MRELCRQAMSRNRRARNGKAVALLGGGSLLVSSASALARAERERPARIHEGSCDDLGPVAFTLNGVGGSVDVDNAPVATPTAVNPETTYQIVISDTAIEGRLDDLLASEHAVMIYESDETMEAVSCGPVGGAMTDNALIASLAEMGTAGHVGFALFREEGDGLSVSVIMGHGLSPVSMAGEDDAHDEGEDAAHEHAEGEDDHDREEKEGAHEIEATPEA